MKPHSDYTKAVLNCNWIEVPGHNSTYLLPMGPMGTLPSSFIYKPYPANRSTGGYADLSLTASTGRR